MTIQELIIEEDDGRIRSVPELTTGAEAAVERVSFGQLAVMERRSYKLGLVNRGKFSFDFNWKIK